MQHARQVLTPICNHLRISPRCVPLRYQSSLVQPQGKLGRPSGEPKSAILAAGEDGLWRLKLSALVRNIVLGKFFSSPRVLRLGTKFLHIVARSQAGLLNTDTNPLLRGILRPLLYEQFCAGATKEEIEKTRQLVLSAGCAGIILAYGKEMQADAKPDDHPSSVTVDRAELEHWRDGNLETLDMIGSQDFLAIKLTGAGTRIINAMMKNEDAPPDLVQALDDICNKARDQGCRLWMDSEYQEIQPAIDRWTIDLMRRHNREKALVYNTVQAYLKHSREKLRHQLKVASQEGWHLGIKLVRGAYIEHDQRDLIHDTKGETDQSYNSIVSDLLSGSKESLGLTKDENFPKMRLFLAGHNPQSIAMAWELTHKLEQAGTLQMIPDFGQLQGMGDQVSCQLLQRAEMLAERQMNSSVKCSVPKIYKYSPWGSVQECMLYLLRRAHENSGGTDRMKDGINAYRSELMRRLRRSMYLAR